MRRVLSFIFALVLTSSATPALADKREHIEAKSREALEHLLVSHPEAERLLKKAAAVLVFPDVVRMGFGVGGEYGEGALLVKDQPVAYYATAGASFGLQVGAQRKSEIILFMTRQSVIDFRNSRGWEVGIDGTIAVVEEGVSIGSDTLFANEPVIGFILSNRGVMAGLSFEGGKISRIAR